MSHRPIADWPRQLAEIRQLMAEEAASLDASGDFPHRNIDVLRRRGFLSLAVPSQYGGAGASLAELQQAIAAIAWGEPATALIAACSTYIICGWRKIRIGLSRYASACLMMRSQTAG